jgi:hypothetical protein
MATYLSKAQYQRAMAILAAREAVSHPMEVPPEAAS